MTRTVTAFRTGTISLAIVAATCAATVTAGDTPIFKVPIKPVPAFSTARMTTFNPETHGFRFVNTFLNITGVFDITTGGLCGGMAYAALDYFKYGIATPRQDYTPVSGTALESYIYGRQMTSLQLHMDKWTELHANPFGARNSEFFNWGLQGTGGGRLQELRAKIDAGQPVPLGLKSLSANPGEDHVVLAYGYDMGRYKGDLGAYKEDLKIYIYEPNFGARRVTLVAKPDRAQWCYLERNNRGQEVCWRTYFVQQNYSQSRPPRVSDNPVELKLDVKTGSDDLRGGNDNVSVEVVLADGQRIKKDNINRGKRWIDRSWNSVGISLPDTVRAGQVRSVSLKTSFGGGIGGDNWNLDELNAELRVGGAVVQSCKRTGSPLVRFDGNNRPLDVNFPC